MDQPPKHYLDLSKAVVRTTGGLPLALKVIGSYLFDKEKPASKDIVKKLATIPHDEVLKKLKISYDGLNYKHKEIFLDITCFFIGTDKNVPCYIWDGCGFFPRDGIQNLCQKSLIKISEKNVLLMHDQLRDLGRKIVRRENRKELGEHSRLWSHEALEVMSTQKSENKQLEVLLLERCYNLATIDASIGNLERLVKLNLSNCYELYRIPDLSANKQLEVLVLEDCKKLATIDASIGHLKKSIEILPNVSNLTKLQILEIEGCEKVTEIQGVDGLQTLVVLSIDGCISIERSPCLPNLKNLRRLLQLQEVDRESRTMCLNMVRSQYSGDNEGGNNTINGC
ncbi:TMV resistance protein N-like [Macadamia integrifolia]|uniref:TMV resistance protein N-like n=1 Tax=Macadamia integrifolia TaxID=60698 RepID=UPI001C532174|nr:TMV resistance protein N-like [Macadamia integrifolia]